MEATSSPTRDTDIATLVSYLNGSSFWVITRPGRWVSADGHYIETQYVRGEGTVTLYKGRAVVWVLRGREVAQEAMAKID